MATVQGIAGWSFHWISGSLEVAAGSNLSIGLLTESGMTQPIQSYAIPTNVDWTWIGEHTVNMSAYTLQAEIKNSDGTVLATKTTGSGITIGNGDNGTGTIATLDLTDGTSAGLAEGFYRINIRRTDSGHKALLAIISLWVEDQEDLE